MAQERVALAWAAAAPERAAAVALPSILAEPQAVSPERAALVLVVAAPERAVRAALLQSKGAVPVLAASALAWAFPQAVRVIRLQWLCS